MLTDAELEQVSWVQRNGGVGTRQLTEAEGTLVVVLCRAFATGPHNLRWSSLRPAGPNGARVATDRDLATYDMNALTGLVFAAHHYAARVAVNPCGPRHVEIMLHIRTHDPDAFVKARGPRYHPTLDEAVATWSRRS